MKSLTNLINEPMTAFGVLGFAYHYVKPEATIAPYAVWQENGDAGFNADNSKKERVLEGIIDFFTLDENDAKLDSIENALIEMGASWSLTAVQYEQETRLIHYSWDWSIT